MYNINAFEKAEDPGQRALLKYLSTAAVAEEFRPLADKVAAFKRLYPDGRPHMKYELDLYDKWCEGKAEGIQQGRREGIEIGEARGREENAVKIALSMLQDNIPFETVAKYTQLSLEAVKSLAK